MTEALKANEHRLNLVSRAALEDLGVNPDPNRLYSLQLVRVTLERKHDGIGMESRRDLLELLELLENGSLKDRHSPQKLTDHQIGASKQDAGLSLEGFETLSPFQLGRQLTYNWYLRNKAETLEM